MFINKDKERASNLTGSIIIITTVSTVQAKDIYLRIEVLNTFLGDRKKFKIYEAQYRMYLWADGKRGD
jgi:hypothetical protein